MKTLTLFALNLFYYDIDRLTKLSNTEYTFGDVLA